MDNNLKIEIKSESLDIFKNAADQYYKSVEKEFSHTMEELDKRYFIDKLLDTLLILFILSVITFLIFVFTSVGITLLKSLFSYEMNNYSKIDDSLMNWSTVFFKASGVLLICCIFTGYSKTKIKEKRLKKLIPKEIWSFCHLWQSINDIKLYNIDNRETHIENAKTNLTKYADLQNISNPYTNIIPSEKNKKRNSSNTFVTLIERIQKKHSWFNIKAQTMDIINAFDNFQSKIIENIINKKNLSQAMQSLECLGLYEFSKIAKPENYSQVLDQKQILVIGENSIIEFSKILESIKSTETKSLELQRGWFTRIKNVCFYTYNLYERSNVFMRFIILYIFLQMVTIISFYTGMKAFNLKMDSTILVYSIAIPFATAAALAGIVKSKDNKN